MTLLISLMSGLLLLLVFMLVVETDNQGVHVSSRTPRGANRSCPLEWRGTEHIHGPNCRFCAFFGGVDVSREGRGRDKVIPGKRGRYLGSAFFVWLSSRIVDDVSRVSLPHAEFRLAGQGSGTGNNKRESGKARSGDLWHLTRLRSDWEGSGT